MRFEFTQNGDAVGAAQWEGPGQVTLHVEDPAERRRLAEYFSAETTYLSTGFGQDEEFQIRRRDWTPWEFERACLALAHRMGYRVHRTPSGAVEARPDGNGHERRPETPARRVATAAFPAAAGGQGDRHATNGNGHDAAAAAPEATGG
jgi:hypothetical protein